LEEKVLADEAEKAKRAKQAKQKAAQDLKDKARRAQQAASAAAGASYTNVTGGGGAKLCVAQSSIDVMSVKELKQALTSCRVDHSTFCEKSELRAALKEALLAESGPEPAGYSGYDKPDPSKVNASMFDESKGGKGGHSPPGGNSSWSWSASMGGSGAPTYTYTNSTPGGAPGGGPPSGGPGGAAATGGGIGGGGGAFVDLDVIDESVGAMSVKELKQALTGRGVEHSTFREKSELQLALKEALLAEHGMGAEEEEDGEEEDDDEEDDEEEDDEEEDDEAAQDFSEQPGRSAGGKTSSGDNLATAPGDDLNAEGGPPPFPPFFSRYEVSEAEAQEFFDAMQQVRVLASIVLRRFQLG
jgi:hypothetical protein